MPPPALYPGPVLRLPQLPLPGQGRRAAILLQLSAPQPGPWLLALKLLVLFRVRPWTHFLGAVARDLCGTSEEAEGREWEPRWAETSPGASSAFSLQAWGPPVRSRMGARKAGCPGSEMPVHHHPLLLPGSHSSQAGSRRPPHIPWWGSMLWALEQTRASAPSGVSPGPSQGGLCALHGCGPERASITGRGVGRVCRSCGARGGPSGAGQPPAPCQPWWTWNRKHQPWWTWNISFVWQVTC